MTGILKQLNTFEKLNVLSRDSRYDLACACATQKDEHRRRSPENKWIYPVPLPQGGRTHLFKTLLSNHCVNDCRYCPLRVNQDPQRCSLTPVELAKMFLQYYYRGRVSGLFVSSAVMHSPDTTMARMNSVAAILRRQHFRGYIHLKIIPGASEAAIRETLRLASAVSLNIEVPGEKNFNQLSKRKNYARDVIAPLKLISRLTAKGSSYQGVKQTTQFIVGASRECDQDIVSYVSQLYQRFGLNRVYFNAYQRGLGEADLPGEQSPLSNAQLLTREHRLYQTDWLLRKYGFQAQEIPFTDTGNLSLEYDPKEMWARAHPEFFPVNVNRASRFALLRVPGFGAVTVRKVLSLRASGNTIRRINELGKLSKLLQKAHAYITF